MSRIHPNPGRIAFILLLVAGVALASCSRKQTSTENTIPPAESTTTTPAAPALSDADIVAIVTAANDADIANGKAAKSISQNSDVKSFANEMVADHSSVNQKLKELESSANLTPADNDQSRAIKTQADAKRDSLKQLKGAAFDQAYANAEVAVHQQVLDMLDNTLIPDAQNPDLKALLQNVRPTISAHLEHAKQVQTAVTK